MRRDPLTQGQAVLEKKCLGCHCHGGQGSGEQTAADLKDFGSRAWVRGLLENPKAAAYFGKVPGPRTAWSSGRRTPSSRPKQLEDVADFVASFAGIPRRHDPR